MNNKEYKVITSNVPQFAESAKLKAVLAEEAQAGWDLEELIDANKIRVSRDKSARSGDSSRTIDPYRINVGMNHTLFMTIAAIVTILVIGAIIYVAKLSVS